jgi:hypothetical protein
LEVVALYVDVLGGVPVLGLLRAGAERPIEGGTRLGLGGALARPGELVALAGTFDTDVAKVFPQRVDDVDPRR